MIFSNSDNSQRIVTLANIVERIIILSCSESVSLSPMHPLISHKTPADLA